MTDLADELARSTDIVMMTRDTVVPADVLAGLGEIAARLRTVPVEGPPRTERLHRAAVDLAAAVEAMMRGEPEASDHFPRREKGILRFLACGKAPSGH